MPSEERARCNTATALLDMALSLDKHHHDFQWASVRAIPPGAQVERFIDPAAVLQLAPSYAATVRRLEKLCFLKEVAQPKEGMAGFEPVLAALRLRYPDAQFLSRGEGGFMWGDDTHQLRGDWLTESKHLGGLFLLASTATPHFPARLPSLSVS